MQRGWYCKLKEHSNEKIQSLIFILDFNFPLPGDDESSEEIVDFVPRSNMSIAATNLCLSEHNAERARAGKAPFTYNAQLEKAAMNTTMSWFNRTVSVISAMVKQHQVKGSRLRVTNGVASLKILQLIKLTARQPCLPGCILLDIREILWEIINTLGVLLRTAQTVIGKNIGHVCLQVHKVLLVNTNK